MVFPCIVSANEERADLFSISFGHLGFPCMWLIILFMCQKKSLEGCEENEVDKEKGVGSMQVSPLGQSVQGEMIHFCVTKLHPVPV